MRSKIIGALVAMGGLLLAESNANAQVIISGGYYPQGTIVQGGGIVYTQPYIAPVVYSQPVYTTSYYRPAYYGGYYGNNFGYRNYGYGYPYGGTSFGYSNYGRGSGFSVGGFNGYGGSGFGISFGSGRRRW